MTTGLEDARFSPAIDVVRHTGMLQFQVRYSDDEDPVVWLCVGVYNVDRYGRPQRAREKGRRAYKIGAGLTPIEALFNLCHVSLKGGVCVHCGKPTGFLEVSAADAPVDDERCLWSWDGERFVRQCEAGA